MSAFLVATGNRSKEPQGDRQGKAVGRGLEGQGESYVRRHAKASSAGSNSGQGSRRCSPGALAAFVIAMLAAAGLLPGSALALETRPPVESFGADGTSTTSFGLPSALAFDQGSKRLYALDQSAESINGFDASTPGTHTPLGGNFPLVVSGSTELLDLAVDS